jgi:hypothetical protein
MAWRLHFGFPWHLPQHLRHPRRVEGRWTQYSAPENLLVNTLDHWKSVAVVGFSSKQLLDRQLEDDLLSSQGLVNSGKGVKLSLLSNTLVQVDLEEAGTIQAVADALSDNLCGVN